MHLTPYIPDPFPAIQTVIAAAMGTKEKVDGIHAGLGIADYAALLILDKDPAPTPPKAVDCSAWSDSAIAAKLEECCKATAGMKAIDWKALWQDVKPLVFQLLQRWLFS